METRTYDPSQFPAFAVTVDVVVLTMAEGRLHVLLVRRGVSPFEGMWAIPGGFKRPDESLDEAAQRELLEETGVDGASMLRQFGAYGDPGRDPRMNVVTIAYLAVLREVEGVMGGTDAAAAELVPVSRILGGRARARVRPQADPAGGGRARPHRPRPDRDRDGVRRPDVHAGGAARGLRGAVGHRARRGELPPEHAGRRRVGRSDRPPAARPGAAGGKPAELYRAGRMWRHGAPIRRRGNQ